MGMSHCAVAKLEDGTEICSLHKQPLQDISDLAQVRNGGYAEMVNTFYCMEGQKEVTTPFTPTQSLKGDKGTAIFHGRFTCQVRYWLTKNSNGWRGWVWHGEGHPFWHPIVPLDPEPFTLVLDNGRRLKVLLQCENGAVQARSDFF